MPEKGLKMVSGWPWGVKNTLQYALWRQSDQNGPFGGDLAPRIRHFAEGPTARGKRRFTQKFVETHGRIELFARGPGTFYFWPVNLFFSLSERGLGMVFCCFHDFPAAVSPPCHIPGRLRSGLRGSQSNSNAPLKWYQGRARALMRLPRAAAGGAEAPASGHSGGPVSTPTGHRRFLASCRAAGSEGRAGNRNSPKGA